MRPGTRKIIKSTKSVSLIYNPDDLFFTIFTYSIRFLSTKALSKNKYNTFPTCRFRRYLEPLLDGGDRAVEVRVTGRKYTTEHTVQEHVSLLVGESLQRGVPYAPYTAGGLVGDGQIPEHVLEPPRRGRGGRGGRGRGRHPQQLQALRPVLLSVVARVILHPCLALWAALALNSRFTRRYAASRSL